MPFPEIFLRLLILFILDSEPCSVEEIALLAHEYIPRYEDAQTGEDWALLLSDLEGEVKKCEDSRPGIRT